MTEKKKSTNARTPHSRAVRAKTATAYNAAVKDQGGWRITLRLQKAATDALKNEMARTGETALAVVTRKLLEK